MRKKIGLSAILLAAVCGTMYAGDYKDECLGRLATIEKSFIDLSTRVPAEKYVWRPAERVRSISEVFLHVAGVNFAITRVFGTPPPQGFSMKGFDTSTTDKTRIAPQVKDSFAHLRKAVEQLSAADADKPVKMFGQDTTMRGALWMALEHLSEHLGQSIAYARANGVTPPWSE